MDSLYINRQKFVKMERVAEINDSSLLALSTISGRQKKTVFLIDDINKNGFVINVIILNEECDDVYVRWLGSYYMAWLKNILLEDNIIGNIASFRKGSTYDIDKSNILLYNGNYYRLES